MIVKHWTLRHLLTLMIALMGGIFLLSMLIVVGVYSNQITTIQSESSQELLAQETNDLLEDHTMLLEEFALRIQANSDFKKAVKQKNNDVITQHLNDEFFKYYITAGMLTVNKIYVFDKHFDLLASSTEGKSNDYPEQLCSNLTSTAKSRKGAEKIKAIDGWCTYSKYAFHSIIVPINTLSPKGYIQVISEPYNFLKKIETKLRAPIFLESSSQDFVYQSKNWLLGAESSDNLLIDHQIKDADNKPVIHIKMLKDVSDINSTFEKSQIIIIFIIFMITVFVILVFLFIFNKYLVKPLQILSEHLNLIKQEKEGLGEILMPSGSPEIQAITSSFNSLNIKLAAVHLSLMDHKENLEERIEERTKELTIARDEAEQANKAKSEFLANMSHELRTPLHAILSFSQFGIKKHTKVPADKVKHYFTSIQQSGTRLLNLVNNLLDLSQLEAGKYEMQFQQISLADIVTQIINEFEIILIENELKLIFEKPEIDTTITCDAFKIGQVIRNLVSNAIKFTPRGKLITIRLDIDPNNQEMIKLCIVDQGVGIPEDELESVFDKFIQSSKTKTDAGGTGLGLSISKEIILQHRGEIYAENAKDGGSVFCFTIPKAQTAP